MCNRAEPSCFEAGPAPGIVVLEPAPAPAPVNIRTVNELSKITCNASTSIFSSYFIFYSRKDIKRGKSRTIYSICVNN